jgi:hypothetical protein
MQYVTHRLSRNAAATTASLVNAIFLLTRNAKARSKNTACVYTAYKSREGKKLVGRRGMWSY